MSRKITTKEFIEKAKSVHGNKYDYSKVEYVKKKEKVCIICLKHGEFWQTPDDHLYGRGCKKCGFEKSSNFNKSSTEAFIEKAKKVHNNKYDYSKVEYKSNKIKVCIICPIHGEFEQCPSAHLQGQGCPKCGKINARKNKTLGKDEFIRRAKEIHGNKYDYSKVNYINSDTKVIISCKKHGEFLLQPKHHLSGCGCQKCSWEANSDEKRLTTEEFIEKAKKVHGDKYDYSKVNYIKSIIPVCIICPTHGEFWQTPNYHLNGRGCQKCNRSRLEREVSILLEKNKIRFDGQKQFDWLGQKSLDFYLPKYNVAIECQGLQHFEPVKHFGGTEYFNVVKKRDEIKKKLCKEHNIKLLYYSDLKIEYPYEVITDKNKLVEAINNNE